MWQGQARMRQLRGYGSFGKPRFAHKFQEFPDAVIEAAVKNV